MGDKMAFSTFAASLQIYHLEIGEKPEMFRFAWLTNHIAPQLLALESCSNPQKTRQVFKSAV